MSHNDEGYRDGDTTLCGTLASMSANCWFRLSAISLCLCRDLMNQLKEEQSESDKQRSRADKYALDLIFEL
jgi:hypothetical protein